MIGYGLRMLLWFPCLAVVVLSPLTVLFAYRNPFGRPFLPTVLVATTLASLGYMAWELDDWVGESSSWIFVAVFAVWGGAVASIVARGRRSRTALVLGGVYVAALLAMHNLDLTPVKPYRRFYDAVATGMTPSEVLAALHREFPEAGRFRVPVVTISNATTLSFLLDRTDGRWDAEIVDLDLVDGRVSGKVYMGD